MDEGKQTGPIIELTLKMRNIYHGILTLFILKRIMALHFFDNLIVSEPQPLKGVAVAQRGGLL